MYNVFIILTKEKSMFYFDVSNEYFCAKDSIECGQYFRYENVLTPLGDGFLLKTEDKACVLYDGNDFVRIYCEENDKDYFQRFFDLDRDYSSIVESACSFGVEFLDISARMGKGIRIFNQNRSECLLNFIVSQQNNIPRIKSTIEKICQKLGNKKVFGEYTYYTYPTIETFASCNEDTLRELGLGYRAPYLLKTAQSIILGELDKCDGLFGVELKKALTKFYGVGNKVADCVALFSFGDASAFPVDTWMEKLYHENFGGTETNRDKINAYFTETFGKNAGYFQQYMFYYKRQKEKK